LCACVARLPQPRPAAPGCSLAGCAHQAATCAAAPGCRLRPHGIPLTAVRSGGVPPRRPAGEPLGGPSTAGSSRSLNMAVVCMLFAQGPDAVLAVVGPARKGLLWGRGGEWRLRDASPRHWHRAPPPQRGALSGSRSVRASFANGSKAKRVLRIRSNSSRD
jgi:hypothetical protein